MRVLIICLLASLTFITSCINNDDEQPDPDPIDGEYTGTGHITQGLAVTTISNLFPNGQKAAALGEKTDANLTTWTVPADVRFTDDTFPFAPDLYNTYGERYNNADEALAALDGSEVIEIDPEGELITAFIYADNYFEAYINGVPVGKDAVPYTDLNSHILRFRVERPFKVAILGVDWEENLGVGSEISTDSQYDPDNGGLIAVFKDEDLNIIGFTNEFWKAQTYYIAPVNDLSCLSEGGESRFSLSCTKESSDDGRSFYAVHWPIPEGWQNEDFDDSSWPVASRYSNDLMFIDNVISYTNFADVFDDPNNDAFFIWSSSLILDNEVLMRGTIF